MEIDSNPSFLNFGFYLIISAHSNEKTDLLNRICSFYKKELDANEFLAKYLKKFLVFEILPLDESQIDGDLNQYEPFQERTEHYKHHKIEFLRQLI